MRGQSHTEGRSVPASPTPRRATGWRGSGLASCLTLPESLGGNAERAVELAGRVLPGDDLGQLDRCVVVVEAADPREQIVADVTIAERDGVRVLQGHALGLRVERAGRVVAKGQDLLVRHAEPAAHGSIDVLSELAAVQRGDTAIEQGLELAVDQPRALDPRPHAAGASQDSWP